ncbi:MAG: hypothetical protein M1839_009378 [Geoglossum umbratile]|nr:MAG: hypothetical protein M1839_009378 [Geoglossum umbratile]
MTDRVTRESAADAENPSAASTGRQLSTIVAGDSPSRNRGATPTAAKASQDQLPSQYQNPQALPSEQFHDDDLSSVLLSITTSSTRSRATQQLLGPLTRVNNATVTNTIKGEFQRLPTGRTVNEVLDIALDGALLSSISTQAESKLWQHLQRTNVSTVFSPSPDDDGNNNQAYPPQSSAAHGRIIVVRSLTPLITLQLLVCLRSHFDVERLLSTFLSKGTSQGFCPQQSLQTQNVWYFSFKYYYLTFDDQAVFPGQDFGVFHEKEANIQIRRGSSLVALQFPDGGGPWASAPSTSWRLLVLSCNRPTFTAPPSLQNGLEAYLWGINQELRGSRRNLRQIAEQITSIATPPDDFLFNPKSRDALLFEDTSYNTSRTYFWALQSLRIMNDTINSIINAWRLYDKPGILTPDQMLELKQDTATPLKAPSTVVALLRDVERQIEQLGEMVRTNNTRQEEIRALRDGLFNASAVLEARTTVAQGQNIRILTIVSMIFLPIGFCTSVFGMQILPKSTNLATLAVVLVAICIPTYGVILGLASGKMGVVGRWIRRLAVRRKEGDPEGGGRP